jgi:predicted O-methyltransferase YrrM
MRSKIWATEEVLLPTLVSLLGYTIAESPCSYDCVKYRAQYSVQQIDSALHKQDVFWVHPVTRQYGDALRKHIRTRMNHYVRTVDQGGVMQTLETQRDTDLLLACPIFEHMRTIEGWLADEEADLLLAASARAITSLPGPYALVEVGSYCGRSTVVLGNVAKCLSPEAKVFAIDPHDGKVGALDQGLQTVAPTLEKFRRNIAAANLSDVVQMLQEYSYKVTWDRPINFLFIDGLHDYMNVARDFYHFEQWVAPNGFIAFHDYADYYPGVKAFVDEILGSGKYRQVCLKKSMILVQKLPITKTSDRSGAV